MGSGVIHTKFHKVWFRHSKVDRGDTHTDTQQGDLIGLVSFFQNKESKLKTQCKKCLLYLL
jgi:hypothetical protein